MVASSPRARTTRSRRPTRSMLGWRRCNSARVLPVRPTRRSRPTGPRQYNDRFAAAFRPKSMAILTFPNSPYELHQPFEPAGDQPEAIEKLIEGLSDGLSFQTLLGVTGSGKTFTM